MLNTALAILHDEHRSLAAVIHGLRYLVQHAQRTGEMSNFKLLWSMLYYIDRFPERLHHPKEEAYLFARLQARTRDADAVIVELRQQHADDARHAADLERALGEYEADQPGGLQAFADALETFADATWKHMNLEETILVPLAKRHLDGDDWVAIGAAFSENGDPRFGESQDREFRDLFSRIVNLAPPPIGLGPAG